MATSERRADIDWLRVAATYLLFVFHVGKVFDPAPFFHIRNSDQSFILLIGCGFIGLWHMPLFFLLAGWSAASSLELRGARTFLRERLHRLGVPLIAGCVLLVPAIKYLELRSGLDLNHAGLRVAAEHQESIRLLLPGGLPVAEPFHESFVTFLPTFFTQLDRFTWSHLWFVAYLLTFTVVYVPLFLWLLRRRDRRSASSPAWVIYLPLVPLVVIQLTMRERWPGIYNLYDDWANIAYYSVFLLSGFFLACHPADEDAVAREWKRSLTLGGLATGVLLLGVLRVFSSPAVLLGGTAVAAWCFVIAFLGIARRYLTASTPTLRYLSESAFPVYVLHQAAIVLPGYLVVGLPLGIATKYVLLLLLAVSLTMGTYHWLVRPFAVPRFLLGMKAKACPLPRAAALSHSVATTVALLVGVALAAQTAYAETPVGVWYAEGGAAKVGIEECGDELCGRVLWLRSPFDEYGCPLRDEHNPNPALRSRMVEGLAILRGLTRRADGTWVDGRIYDPASGDTYHCQLALDGNDRIHLRGYVGIPLIGRTTTWTRVGAAKRMCAATRE
jgi:uncharacterized protein (DUF2147 family)